MAAQGTTLTTIISDFRNIPVYNTCVPKTTLETYQVRFDNEYLILETRHLGRRQRITSADSVFTPPKAGVELNLYTREDWGGKPPLEGGPLLDHPVDHVRFTHTFSFECFNLAECGVQVRRIQRAHMEQNKTDIQYNFLIGADLRIYEGAGWFADCWKPPELRHLHKRCLDITYLGNYTLDYPPKEMQALGKKIIDYGVLHNYIKSRVKILRITDPDCTVMD